MKTITIGFRVILLLGYLLGSFGLAAKSSFDVVTMINGDIHNGTLAQERFNLKTSYGLVSVPYAHMAHLQRYGETIRITTLAGDQFSGVLVDDQFTMLRGLDPLLPLAPIDIQEAIFANRFFKLPPTHSPDLVIAGNGDTFAGRILTSDFLVKSEQGIRMIGIDAIQYMDFSLSFEDEKMHTQITKSSGSSSLGLLMIGKVRVRIGFGAVLEMAVGQLSAIAMGVNQPDQRSDYLFRKSYDHRSLVQDQMRDGRLGPKMLILKGGQAHRGDLQGNGDGDEQPSQETTIPSFAIGLHEVTFEEYDQYCEATGKTKPDDQEWGRGHRPVVNVSWEEAAAYTEWLSQRFGKRYRLPTDAEWEYAARAGSKTRFWWGNDVCQA